MGRPRTWFAACAVLYAAVWAWSWTRLPERVPTHFGGGGQPDDWSSRAAALWFSGLLGLGMVLLFAGLVQLVRRAPAAMVDAPRPEYWKRPENLGRLRKIAVADLWLLGAWTLLLLTAVDWLVVRAATAEDPALGPWPLLLVGGYLVGVLGRVVWMVTRRYPVPENG
ncbi:DUF1648 domain-containing protein [Blastococcus sp. HT6-30]|uniref:DUF1648 domain-containing protein n=1 Tax=Blastococcus sp. HT6-30 TaxID=3144843 RepID=UPI00321B02B3